MKKKTLKKKIATKKKSHYLVQFHVPASLDVTVEASSEGEAKLLAKAAVIKQLPDEFNEPRIHLNTKQVMIREWGFDSGAVKLADVTFTSVDSLY